MKTFNNYFKIMFLFLLVMIWVGLLPHSTTAADHLATNDDGHRYLTEEQYPVLNEMFRTHVEYFLDPQVITISGLPLTALKPGDRARYGYSNPTEWGYALQAWIAAAERKIISENEAMQKIGTALSTMQTLQIVPWENSDGLFYPFYTLTDSQGNDLSVPEHVNDPRIPSGDLALLYASLLITEGWARQAGNGTVEAQAQDIRDNMDFRRFLFSEHGNLFLAHQFNEDTGDLSKSKWDIYADEGGVVAWIAYVSGSITFQEYLKVTSAQLRRGASWHCSGDLASYYVGEATWFNAQFALGVRSLAGFPGGLYDSPAGTLSAYNKMALIPAVNAHMAYGDCLGVDYPAFSDAMTQTSKGIPLVGRYTPPNLAGIAPKEPPEHVMPHAFFIPFNAGPELPPLTIVRLVSEIVDLRDDKAGYYHKTGLYPFGFEVTTSPYKNDLTYTGADDGRPVFETLSQAYIVLSLFNGLQLDKVETAGAATAPDNNHIETFYTFASNVPGYVEKLRQVLPALYPSRIYLPIIKAPLCFEGHFKFGSGSSSPYPEERSITIDKNCFQAGANKLVLENANSPGTGHWMMWDSLYLKTAQGSLIWQIGDNEAPPDYDDTAFDEFDRIPPFNAIFDVGTMSTEAFPFELNDSDFTTVTIQYVLTSQQANQSLVLFLDTLFATHDDIPDFEMRLEVISP